MGVWGLDIYDDDLAVDIRDEFQDYLDQGMDENDAMNEVIFNNDNLLEEDEECGTFILTIGLLAKENEISNSKINKLLSDLRENKNYWNYLKEDSMYYNGLSVDAIQIMYCPDEEEDKRWEEKVDYLASHFLKTYDNLFRVDKS